jgi:hypothetical protein
MELIERLAERQLEAYNASDLDAFVACYHRDVRVWDGSDCVCEGIASFRARYKELFERFKFGAVVPQRLTAKRHCVDLEHWWRLSPETSERQTGTVFVHYTAHEDRIIEVRFLPAD